MKRVVDRPEMTIYHGNAEDWVMNEPVDFILTNPYGKMPFALSHTPAIIHQWRHRHDEAQRWSHMNLRDVVATWNDDREVFWANRYVSGRPLDLAAYRPEPGGWYPEQMVRELLGAFVGRGATLWDGFMGRGTIGKVCREMGIRYIGVEQLEQHIALAKTYLEIT